MNPRESLHLICCPDCEGDLHVLADDQAYMCCTCETIFPCAEGIPILLDSASRNPAFEAPLLRKLLPNLENEDELRAYEKSMEKLSTANTQPSYAWEDEAHWSKEYAERLARQEVKNWNDRKWQREPLFIPVINFLQTMPQQSRRLILDLGCGEGQDFQHFLVNEISPDDIYVGMDISLQGLLLNRALNPHKNALYVVGSADKPPLRRAIADVIISMGTLHHMQSKEKGLMTIQRLSRGGYITLSDPVHGEKRVDFNQFPLNLLHLLPGRDRSAHDDSLNEKILLQQIEDSGLQIIYQRRITGIVYYLLLRVLRPVLLRSRFLHALAHRIDEISAFCFSRWLPIFRPAGLLLLLKVE